MQRPRILRQSLTIPLGALQEELNRILAHYRDLGPIGPTAQQPTEIEPSAWTPAVDLLETADEIRVWVDVPGIDPSAIELTVTGPLLSLRGERRPVTSTEGREHVAERPVGPFHRNVQLPSEVDLAAIRADARDGVLEIRLPKTQAVRPRTIPIKPAPG